MAQHTQYFMNPHSLNAAPRSAAAPNECKPGSLVRLYRDGAETARAAHDWSPWWFDRGRSRMVSIRVAADRRRPSPTVADRDGAAPRVDTEGAARRRRRTLDTAPVRHDRFRDGLRSSSIELDGARD